MRPQYLTFFSFFPLSLLVLDGPSTSIALWSLIITTVGGLVKQWLDLQRIRIELDKNTRLTTQSITAAKAAYVEANNVNGKIAALHAANSELMAAVQPKSENGR